MIRLVFLDIDGTLHGPMGVPECAWKAAEQARAAGVHLAICTGRPGRGFALEYAQRLEASGLHIFESGAVVRDGFGKIVHSLALSTQHFIRVVELGREFGVPFEIYTERGGFFIEKPAADLEAHQRMIGIQAELYPAQNIGDRVVRVQFVAREGESWLLLRNKLRLLEGVELHEATSPALPGIGFNSVTASGVSKLSAARFVAAYYQLGIESAAMVGDGENDLELIQSVGLGIAMGEAPASVKKAARRVVSTVENCGLAEALQLVLA